MSKRMDRSSRLTVVDKSISLRTKVLPARTALDAWLSEPIKERSSLFLQNFLVRHDARSDFKWLSL